MPTAWQPERPSPHTPEIKHGEGTPSQFRAVGGLSDLDFWGRPLEGEEQAVNPQPTSGPTTTVAPAAEPATSTVPRNPIRLLPPEVDPDFDFGPAEVNGNISAPPKRRFRRTRRGASSEPKTRAPLAAGPPTAEHQLVVPHTAEVRRVALDEPDGIEAAASRPPDEPGLVETDSSPTKTSRRFGKLILVGVTILVVVAIVAIIRSSASNPDSGGSLTPTTVTHTSTPPTELIPVSSTVKSDFSAASVDLTTANAAVTHALAGGAAQSPSQVAQEIAPYVTALNTFNFRTHYLAWPATLTVPAQDLTLRTSELISFLSSISSVTPTTLTSWFAQLHSLGRLSETTDNALRKDIGLPAATSYPT
jgi:hypothetical protein